MEGGRNLRRVGQTDMLLIYPPVSKPSEPPPGIALLAGALRKRGVRCVVWDANIEALIDQIHEDRPPVDDTWTLRSRRHRSDHLNLLRGWAAYANLDRYKRAVLDLNRILEVNSREGSLRAGLGNLSGEDLLPVRSDDLIAAARNPGRIPFHDFLEKRLLQIVDRHNPAVVGFSLCFMSQALCTFAMIGMLRRHFPGIKVILGGGLVTSWKRGPDWHNPFGGLVDAVVDGPGEPFLLEISGYYAREREPVRADFNDLPWDMYLAPGRILPYSASSGCYWNRCAFCPEKAEGNPYRPVHPDRVLQDLSCHVEELQPVLIHFLDNAMSPALLRALCRHPLQVPWYGFARVTKDLCDPDFCADLRRSGCVMLKLGIESGSQRVLDAEGKGLEVKTAEEALKCLKRAGIATYVYLLFGTVSETESDARQTMIFSVRNSCFIDHLNLALFNLPVNSEVFENFEKMRTYRHYDGDLSLYVGFQHPLGWDRPLVRQFLDKELKRHPLIAQILKREPPIFTSNHAPFFSDVMRASQPGSEFRSGLRTPSTPGQR
jgi:hypothetical protein